MSILMNIRHVKHVFGGFAILLLVHTLCPSRTIRALGQGATTAPRPEFEVASVKPNNSGSGNAGFGNSSGGRLTVTNATLRLMIRHAYDIQDFQISGGPSWVDSDRYDISAKAENPVAAEVIWQMLQSLLADRFQLRVHHETREGPVYALMEAKGGANLAEPTGTGTGIGSGKGRINGTNATMQDLAALLTTSLGRTVIDKTGIGRRFDFKLTWTADLASEALAPADPSAPSIFTAMQEQLGLRLESQKGPVDYLVIDRAEKPN